MFRQMTEDMALVREYARMLLAQGQATLEYEGGRLLALNAGDSVLIPAHQRHRVVFTSREPPCIWLAIHGQLTLKP